LASWRALLGKTGIDRWQSFVALRSLTASYLFGLPWGRLQRKALAIY